MNGMRKVWGKVTVIAVLAATAFAVHPLTPADGSQIFERTTTNVAPGVTLTKMKVSGPNHINMLTIDPTVSSVHLDVTTAHKSLPGFQQTSTMAKSIQNSVAAVNGDFGLYVSGGGRPAHAYAEDGDFKQTSVLGNSGKNFSYSQDKTASFIGTPKTPSVTVTGPSHVPFTVENWNHGGPGAGEVSGWTSFGGSLEQPTRGLCAARLVNPSAPAWGPSQMSVVRTYTVDAEACGSNAMSLGNGIVIGAASNGNRAGDIKGLVQGSSVSVAWSFGWPGVMDSMGGSPILIDNGKIVVSNCGTYLCDPQPRTVVGITDKGKILLVTIDGRWPGYSVGMTELQEANFMKNQGAVYAMNLDGGGSSTLWAKGRIQNRPSDGTERAVADAIVVLSGPDTGEPTMHTPQVQGAAPSATRTASAADQSAAWHAALTDPGSTGGLLDSLAGQGRTLSPVEQQWVNEFRAAQK